MGRISCRDCRGVFCKKGLAGSQPGVTRGRGKFCLPNR